MRGPRVRALAALAACAAVVALAAPPATAAAAERAARPLRVLAAASLTDVLARLAPGFDGAPIETSVGGSSALARQIRDGAPADVFLSASRAWMDFLRDAGALAGEAPLVLARNRLVAITARGGRVAARGAGDPRALLAALGTGARVGIADEGVPAGEYARHALRHLALLAAYRPLLVGQQDVRAVLNAVERGELDAGFVYATDARVAEVAVLFTVDPAAHPPIEYLAAALRGAAQPAMARRFLAYLASDTARAVLAGAGFTPPGSC